MRQRVSTTLGLLGLPLSFLIHGCAPSSQPELNQLRSELNRMKQTLKTTDGRLSRAEAKLMSMEFVKDMYKNVSFDVSEPGKFQRLDTNNGTLLVSLKDAQPYLNGYRLSFNIGNPSSATYNGFKAKVRWGKALSGGIDYDEWQKSLHEKDMDFLENLSAGTWNRIMVHLAPATSQELGTLELSITTDTISMRVK